LTPESPAAAADTKLLHELGLHIESLNLVVDAQEASVDRPPFDKTQGLEPVETAPSGDAERKCGFAA
jgi:hypothetical protein